MTTSLNTIFITYEGRTVAIVTDEEIAWVTRLEARERRMAEAMAVFAGLVLRGSLGPSVRYSDKLARRFAWALLLPESALRRGRSAAQVAHELSLPEAEIRKARRDRSLDRFRQLRRRLAGSCLASKRVGPNFNHYAARSAKSGRLT